MSKWLDFRVVYEAGRKTPIIEVRSKSQGNLLGSVKWYSPWRQYVFFPLGATVWNHECLNDIQNAIHRAKELAK